MKKISIFYTLISMIGVLFFYSCSETEYPETRLFSPVLNQGLSSHLNTITVDLANFKDATSYKIEISRDTFKTPEKIKVYNFTESKAIIENLLWNTTYQVRATALASTEAFNSKVSNLGAIKTERFPSDLIIAKKEDLIDTGARVSWVVNPKSDPITTIKVFAKDDEELLNPLASYETTDIEKLNGKKVISNLDPNTKYQLAIYSGNVIKGWDFYTTLPALVVGPSDIDLRGVVPDNTTLFNALTNATAGGTVILDPVQVYPIGSKDYFFDKALTIKSGYSLANSTGAIIDNRATSNSLELATDVAIDKIVFDGVSFIGDVSSRYVFRGSKAISSTVGELRFVNCKITNYRDVIRNGTQWTSGGITLFTMDACIVTNVGNNGLVIVDGGVNNSIPNIVLKNSTFSKIQKLTNNKSTTNSVGLTISDCTFAETPTDGTGLLNYGSTTDISSPIIVKNTIFGTAATALKFSFITSGHLKSTTISSSNTYTTSDVTLTPPVAPSTTPMPSFSTYSGTSVALWVDPANGDFNFKDTSFAGSKTAGDPRWRK